MYKGKNRKITVLTSINKGRRVTLCMGRMRKEIIGKFLQSSWDSIRDNTSLNAGFVALVGKRRRELNRMFYQRIVKVARLLIKHFNSKESTA